MFELLCPIAGEVIVRDDSAYSSGIGGSLSDSTISDVFITHQKCGMWVDGPTASLLVSGVVIRDTTADGINFHKVRALSDEVFSLAPLTCLPEHSRDFRTALLSIAVLETQATMG